MPKYAIIQTVGRNVKMLRKSGLTPEGSRSIAKFAAWVGVPNGTVDRIERAKTDPQISHLIRIAAKYEGHGIRIWHLFIPNLDPLALPAYLTAQEMAFHASAQEAYARLQASKPEARQRP